MWLSHEKNDDFFCLFFVKTTHKRESTLILVQRSAPQCSMMIPIQLQMFASSLALMAQLFVLFLPSLRPLVARRAYWATRPSSSYFWPWGCWREGVYWETRGQIEGLYKELELIRLFWVVTFLKKGKFLECKIYI